MSTALDTRKYRRLFGGAGILTACGLILYKRHEIQKLLSSLTTKRSQETAQKPEPDYIYIKYHIYRESMRILRAQQEQDKNWVNVIIHPIGKWWKAFKHSVAWRLLQIAQSGDQQERLKAVRQLASIDHLKDWDFRHLAQICDPRTAVSLARNGCDNRWFVPVHMNGVIKNPKLVLADLRKILEGLQSNSCVKYFLKKYFTVTEIEDTDMDEFYAAGTAPTGHESDLLKEIISFLHHITKDAEVSYKIIKEGGLKELLELKKIFANDNETLANLCKTLANMSLAEDCLYDFFATGWVGVLAEWQTHPDLRLQVISAKALANLDKDDPNNFEYPPNVYPLHPRLRSRRKPKGDIVFIHGLLGGVFITWRQKDRIPTELGLYGKNAFYTSEADDVFLVGETKRVNGRNGKNGNGNNRVNSGNDHSEEKVHPKLTNSHEVSPTIVKNRPSKKQLSIDEISDKATKELVQALQTSAELSSDWEVIHPDIPLKANENCEGEFSVAGDKWRNDDNNEEYTNCWPMDWLPEDHPNTRIIGIDYTSAVTEWSANFSKYCPCEKNQGHIEVRAKSLLERISRSKVGENRPVVWIGHSMGGILCKHILLKALEDSNQQVQQLAKNTRGIIFLGTPHRGSPIAKWKQHMQMILSPSIEVKEMEEGAPKLIELHNRFMRCLRTQLQNVNVVSIAEGTPTMLTTFKFPLRIVTEESARIDYGDFYILKDDHLSLSKPIFRQSFLYQRLLQVIDKSIKDQDPPKHIAESQNSEANVILQRTQSILNIFPSLLVKCKRSIEN